MGADDFHEQVSSLIELDEDALLVRLADEVVLGVGPLDPDRKRAVARAWMDAQRERLRLTICRDPRIQALRETASDERIELAAAVADLVATVTGKLPAATVATLVVKAAEHGAEALVRYRLEHLAREVLPAARSCGVDRPVEIHVRPLRSRLHAALTLPAGDGALIVIDDAVHDLTMSFARWLTACWAPPHVTPGVARPPVALYDAVRVVRAELGAVRWNGALWQPVVPTLPDESRMFAAMLGELAMKFVLAHEIGHIALGHLDRGEHDDAGNRARELQADAYAARVFAGGCAVCGGVQVVRPRRRRGWA